MLLTRAVSVGALLIASVRFASAAQSLAPLTRGTRIRITLNATPAQTVVGTLDTIGSDSIRLRPEGGRVASRRVAVSAIDGIDVSRGQRAYGWQGARVGGEVGLGVGLFAGIATCKWFIGQPDDCKPGVVFGAPVAGVLVGYIVGSRFHSERWDAVPLTSLRVAPVSLNRVGMTVSLSF